MELHPEFIRDIHHHYMIIKANTKDQDSKYSAKMLMNNVIPGMLNTELRFLDCLELYYYDITAKRNLKAVYEGKTLDYLLSKTLIDKMLQIIENSQEYLLVEHDFIIQPEYMFFDENNQLELCYMPGFSRNISEQLSYFFEYIMNKIDYKDEAAVRLIYALYKESKDIECTFHKLYEILDETKRLNDILINETIQDPLKESLKESIREPKKELKKLIKKEPIKEHMKESKKEQLIPLPKKSHYIIKSELDKNEVVHEKEVIYFTKINYIMAGVCVVLGLTLLTVVFFLGLLDNSLGSGVDLVKLLAFLFIIICVEVYIMSKIFDPNKKVTKMESVIEYIKNSDNEYEKEKIKEYEKENIKEYEKEIENNKENKYFTERSINENKGIIGNKNNNNEDTNCLLNNFCNMQKPQEGYKEHEENKTQILWNLYSSQDEKTQVLTYIDKKKYFYLTPIYSMSANSNEQSCKIKVSEFPFYIGKSNHFSQMIIEDKSISRRHGIITCIDDKMLYTDLDSTNGTFINGKRLEGNKPYELSPFDEVSFSNKKYLWEELVED